MVEVNSLSFFFRFKPSASLTTSTESDTLLQAVQISTGDKIRWKCRLCYLSFSREKAFINHFYLQVSKFQNYLPTDIVSILINSRI